LQPGLVESFGWALVHFIWQGLALALSLYVFVAFCRNAITRYWAAVLTLVLMVAAPLVTLLVIGPASDPASMAFRHTDSNLAGVMAVSDRTGFAAAAASLPSVNWIVCFAAAWLAGVLAFALRALGGWMLVQRLYRNERQPLAPLLSARCAALQESLGISRKVQFFLSSAIDAPAVIGWFRPVVLLPFTALTGLSPEQLEAILVHELAHIRRFDCFVNLFQIAAETLLFYHPAVWWVSRMIRAERENCCDDLAVAACGDVGVYARALTVVESWRAMPALVVAANSSSLKLRIERLLGLKAMATNVSSVGIAALGLICAAGVLLAGSALRPNPKSSITTTAAVHTRIEAIGNSWIAAAEPHPAPRIQSAAAADPVPATDAAAEQKSKPSPTPAPKTSTEASPDSSSYIDGLRDAGLKNIDVNQLIALKIQGVTPQYIRDIRSTGLAPDIGEIIAMKVQGVTPDYIRKVRDAWPGTNIGEIIAMKVQGVSASDASSFRSVGLADLNVGQLIAFRVQGITPEYVRSLQGAGLTDLTAGNIIAAKVQGITPEFIQKVRSHGFTNLTLHQLIGLKTADVF
jgi:beta-lactamase regulating signal transducer with metallopeptidase domain